MDLGCPIIKRTEIIMWICVYPTKKQTLIQKMVEREAFLMKPKCQYHLAQWAEWVYGTQSWKEMGLLCEVISVQIDGWTLTLKNYGNKTFLMKPKHQCHLSQWGEWVYGP